MIGGFRSYLSINVRGVGLTEILETFPRLFCFPKSRINENGGKTSICFSFLFVDIYKKYACHTFAHFKTFSRARCSFYF